MMRSNDATEKTNRQHSVDHSKQTKHLRLTEARSDGVTYNAERRKNQNINLRMTKEPEQMLKENRIAATRRIKERRSKGTIQEKTSDTPGKHG